MGAPKPESLEAKFRLLHLAPLDRRMKRKHLAVYGFILDWFHSRYGDALASVRHIVDTLKERDPEGVGLYVGDVHSALGDLVSWGYLTAEKGSGRRASRYVPVWENPRSVHKTPNTTEDQPSVRENYNTSVRETPNATGDSVRGNANEDPLTGPGHQTRGHVMGDMFEAAPVAPRTDGLEATVAGPASGDGFSDFWNAWPRKHGLKQARAEWKKVAADAEVILAAADAWAAHFREHDVDKKWIPSPAKWLADERWLEDLPIIHLDAKGAAIAKAKANAKPRRAANDDRDPRSGEPKDWPRGRHVGQFVAGRMESKAGEEAVVMTFQLEDGTELVHRFYAQADHSSVQDEGHRTIRAICDALGLTTVNDTSDWLNLPIAAVADGKTINYEAA